MLAKNVVFLLAIYIKPFPFDFCVLEAAYNKVFLTSTA